MAAAPDQYHSIVTSTQITKGNALTLQDVEHAMTQYWRMHIGVKNNGNGNNRNSSDKEVVMNYVSGRGNGGRGNGGRGRGRGGRGGKGPCWICKGAHMRRDCWELDSNASKRPRNWTSKLTSEEKDKINTPGYSAANVNGWKGNILLCFPNQQFPESPDLLSDPNIFIMDSGATQHVTKTPIGLTNTTKPTAADAALTANGTVTTPKQMGQLHVVACDNQGTEKDPLTFGEIAHCPDSPFNVVSITTLIKQKWKVVSGDDTHFTIISPTGQELTFDIIIKTSKGFLWATYLKRVQPTTTGMIAASVSTQNMSMNIDKAHRLLGSRFHKVSKSSIHQELCCC